MRTLGLAQCFKISTQPGLAGLRGSKLVLEHRGVLEWRCRTDATGEQQRYLGVNEFADEICVAFASALLDKGFFTIAYPKIVDPAKILRCRVVTEGLAQRVQGIGPDLKPGGV